MKQLSLNGICPTKISIRNSKQIHEKINFRLAVTIVDVKRPVLIAVLLTKSISSKRLSDWVVEYQKAFVDASRYQLS